MAGFAGPNIVTDKLQFLVDSKNDQSYPGSGTTLTDITGKWTRSHFSKILQVLLMAL